MALRPVNLGSKLFWTRLRTGLRRSEGVFRVRSSSEDAEKDQRTAGLGDGVSLDPVGPFAVNEFVNPQDQSRDDDREQVLLDRDAEEFASGGEFDREDSHLEGIAIPDVGDRVENEDRHRCLPEGTRPTQQQVRDRSPEQFSHEVGVPSEDADIGSHAPTTSRFGKTSRDYARRLNRVIGRGRPGVVLS